MWIDSEKENDAPLMLVNALGNTEHKKPGTFEYKKFDTDFRKKERCGKMELFSLLFLLWSMEQYFVHNRHEIALSLSQTTDKNL